MTSQLKRGRVHMAFLLCIAMIMFFLFIFGGFFCIAYCLFRDISEAVQRIRS
jgi:ABC-type polysaccharide/polyol phosphate export permease